MKKFSNEVINFWFSIINKIITKIIHFFEIAHEHCTNLQKKICFTDLKLCFWIKISLNRKETKPLAWNGFNVTLFIIECQYIVKRHKLSGADSKFSTNTLREFLSREFGHQSTTTGETLIYSRKLGESPSEVAIIINQVINPNKT